MDWCVECGEILIGVETVVPNSKKKLLEEAFKKKKISSIKPPKKEVNKSTEGSLIRKEQVENSRYKTGHNYLPKDSPESGKGLSVGNSPVRFQRERSHSPVYRRRGSSKSPLRPQAGKDDPGEPKDSGRESSGDLKDRIYYMSSDCDANDQEDSNKKGKGFERIKRGENGGDQEEKRKGRKRKAK